MFITLAILGEGMECHLGGDLGQALHQKVRRPHPHLQRAEGMFGRLATLARREVVAAAHSRQSAQCPLSGSSAQPTAT
jgi:hypothetical protein